MSRGLAPSNVILTTSSTRLSNSALDGMIRHHVVNPTVVETPELLVARNGHVLGIAAGSQVRRSFQRPALAIVQGDGDQLAVRASGGDALSPPGDLLEQQAHNLGVVLALEV